MVIIDVLGYWFSNSLMTALKVVNMKRVPVVGIGSGLHFKRDPLLLVIEVPQELVQLSRLLQHVGPVFARLLK